METTRWGGYVGGYMGIMEKKLEATTSGLGFSKIRGTSLGVPTIRILVYIRVHIGVPLFSEITMYLDLQNPHGNSP